MSAELGDGLPIIPIAATAGTDQTAIPIGNVPALAIPHVEGSFSPSAIPISAQRRQDRTFLMNLSARFTIAAPRGSECRN